MAPVPRTGLHTTQIEATHTQLRSLLFLTFACVFDEFFFSLSNSFLDVFPGLESDLETVLEAAGESDELDFDVEVDFLSEEDSLEATAPFEDFVLDVFVSLLSDLVVRPVETDFDPEEWSTDVLDDSIP
jgi:hypothetical protein